MRNSLKFRITLIESRKLLSLMPLFDAKRLVKEFEIIHPNLANEVKIIDNRLSLYCREDKTFSDIKDFKINGCARCMNVFTKLSNLYLINCKVY